MLGANDSASIEPAGTSSLIGESDFILESNHELAEEIGDTHEINHTQSEPSTTDIPEIMSPDQDA